MQQSQEVSGIEPLMMACGTWVDTHKKASAKGVDVKHEPDLVPLNKLIMNCRSDLETA